jgi:hypothetical protein
MRKTLFYGGSVLTQLNGLTANSRAGSDSRRRLGPAPRTGIQVIRKVQSQRQVHHSRTGRCAHACVLLGADPGPGRSARLFFH